MKKSNLYTKTGDKGSTSLYSGERVFKSSAYMRSLGDLDELNCHIGMSKALWQEEVGKCVIQFYSAPGAGSMNYRHAPSIVPSDYNGPPLYYEWFALGTILTDIQRHLMDICSVVATPGTSDFFETSWTIELEQLIDRLDSLSPPLKNFVVPSGNKLTASIHICRSVTRRCERNTIGTVVDGHGILVYLNRLSDFFFALTRFVSITLGIEEDLKVRALKSEK